MSALFIEILNMSLSASCVALIVMLIRSLIRKAPKKYAYALWGIVFFRLACPFTIQLPVNAVPIQTQTIPHDIVYSESPSVQSGVSVIDNVVNTVIERSLPPVSPVNSINPVQVVLEIGTYLWLGGILTLLLYAIISYVRLKKRVGTAIRRYNNIYETEFIKTPFVLGLIHPKIYIPTGLDEKELDYIIEHEQTHIKRFDYLLKPLAFLITSVHWFNPVVWSSYMLMARDMELSADESVMRRSGIDIRREYSNSLLVLSVKKSGLLSPLAYGETGVKERIKNVLNYKKPAFWVSMVAIVIVTAATLLLIGGRTLEADEETPDNAMETIEQVTSNSPQPIVTPQTDNLAATSDDTPELPSIPYNKAKITFAYSREGYSWSTGYDDFGIIRYLHTSLANDLISRDDFDPRNKWFNEYQIELSDDIGGYSCMLYHDVENDRAYVVKDGGAHEISSEFARNVDCFLRDVNKGWGGKRTASELFRQHGWTLGNDIAAWPYYTNSESYKMPDFSTLAAFTPNQYYFAYNNELSKDIGLDMSKYAGSEVTVGIYRLLESMPQAFYPTQNTRGIVIWKDSEIIGAFISAGRHSTFNACSLKGNGFETITGQAVDEWLESKVIPDWEEELTVSYTPEQIIERYFLSLDKQAYKSAESCISKRTLMENLTTNMPDGELFNQSVVLPLAGEGFGDKGSGNLFDNLQSAKLVSIEPISDNKFKAIVNLQYRDDFLVNNSSGEQFWECHMVYESPQTGWKIVEFGH